MSRAERIVIVGASLAGLHAAEALRDGGFTGSLTLIGEEPHLPYDRPPLSKQVALGMVSHEWRSRTQRLYPSQTMRSLTMTRRFMLASSLVAGLATAVVSPAYAGGAQWSGSGGSASWSGPYRSGSANWGPHGGWANWSGYHGGPYWGYGGSPYCCYGGFGAGAAAGLAVGTAAGIAATSHPAPSVVYAPPPVVYTPPPVVYAAPPPVVYAPAPVDAH